MAKTKQAAEAATAMIEEPVQEMRDPCDSSAAIPPHELRGCRIAVAKDAEAARQAAADLRDQASARVDQESRSHPQGEPARLRAAIVARNQAEARVNLVASLSNDSEPVWAVPSDAAVAVEVLERYFAHNRRGALGLVARVEYFLHDDEAELEQVRAEIEQSEPWVILSDGGGRVARLLLLETRLSLRRQAVEAARRAFAEKCRDATAGYGEHLASGLHEALAQLGQFPRATPEIEAAEARLTAIHAKLRPLTPATGISPGPEAVALQDEQKAVTAGLEALRTAHEASVAGDVRAMAERATAGDASAWDRVIELMQRQSGSFPVELIEPLSGAGVAALVASDPLLWCAALESGGRDF